MKHYYPAYYRMFRCIACECPDSCCQGWDVVVDSASETYYDTVEGELGDRLRAALYTDSDGDRVFRLARGKKCPFWRADKLCEIQRTLGEERLCETCAQFPRLSMEFTDFCEHSLALACPEAARLIMDTDGAYASFTQRTSSGCGDYDAGDMELLLASRKRSAELLTADKPLCERLTDCLRFAEETQARLYPSCERVVEPRALESIARVFAALEYIDDPNREKLVSACRPADFSGQEAELTRLALYYLYRYYLGAVDSLDVLTPIKHMAVSLSVISNMSREYSLTLAGAAQLYSKEAEQSYENMEILYGALRFL